MDGWLLTDWLNIRMNPAHNVRLTLLCSLESAPNPFIAVQLFKRFGSSHEVVPAIKGGGAAFLTGE